MKNSGSGVNGNTILIQNENLDLTNNGVIEGFYGVEAMGGDTATLVNNGTIIQHDDDVNFGGTAVYLSAVQSSQVINNGRIAGSVLTLGREDGSEILNRGTIDGVARASDITNSGRIGTVELNYYTEGRYDGRRGFVETGEVEGTALNDVIYGGRGYEHISGNDGDDFINGGAGSDLLEGGIGADTFQFNRRAGDAIIADFEDGVDHIDFSLLRVSSYEQIEGAMSTNVNGDAVIDLSDLGVRGARGSVTLEGVSEADLSASDFLF